MSVLLIGGCGFIGSHIASALSAKGIPIVVFDRNADVSKHSIGVRHIKGEFGNRGELEIAIKDYGVSSVVHLVSSTIPKSSNADPEFDVSSNVCETIALLQFCVEHSIRKIVFLSSGGTVYGSPRYSPIDEDHPTNPICSYGITKLAIEKYLALYHRLYGLGYTAIRAANPYGTGQNPFSTQGIIPVFIYQMLHKQALHVFGSGEIVRDYFHVRDLADLCVKALMSDYCGICNAGSGIGTSIDELIALLSGTLHINPNVVRKDGRLFDAPQIVLDCGTARKHLNWTPTIPLNEGIAEVASWIKTSW
jgi:UDP-glucose 4-epimerase